MYTQWDAPAPDVADIAVFRSYVQDLHTKLTTHGLTHISLIPNQFNFTSEPDPANDALTGLNKTYRPLYYTFSDDLIPTFIKIEFFKVNSGSNAANRQRVLSRVTVSTSIDVNGNQFNIVAQYTNSTSGISSNTTYVPKNGNSLIYTHSTVSNVKFGVISTPRYSYNIITPSITAVFLLIERTATEIVVWGNTNNVTGMTVGTPSPGDNVIAQYVGNVYYALKLTNRTNPVIQNTLLANTGSVLLESYVPLISGGMTRESNTIYYYNKSSYSDGSLNVIDTKTYFMLGNHIAQITNPADCGIAILIGD